MAARWKKPAALSAGDFSGCARRGRAQADVVRSPHHWAAGGVTGDDAVAIGPRLLPEAGVDLVDVSTARPCATRSRSPAACSRRRSRFRSQRSRVATMCVGNITTRIRSIRFSPQGVADLVALGAPASGRSVVHIAARGLVWRVGHRLPAQYLPGKEQIFATACGDRQDLDEFEDQGQAEDAAELRRQSRWRRVKRRHCERSEAIQRPQRKTGFASSLRSSQ